MVRDAAAAAAAFGVGAGALPARPFGATAGEVGALAGGRPAPLGWVAPVWVAPGWAPPGRRPLGAQLVTGAGR